MTLIWSKQHNGNAISITKLLHSCRVINYDGHKMAEYVFSVSDFVSELGKELISKYEIVEMEYL